MTMMDNYKWTVKMDSRYWPINQWRLEGKLFGGAHSVDSWYLKYMIWSYCKSSFTKDISKLQIQNFWLKKKIKLENTDGVKKIMPSAKCYVTTNKTELCLHT